MTDQTVPVPVDLLLRYKRDMPIAMSTYGSLRELYGYIPTPPKVGDELTEEQINALPSKAVVRDTDGDIWIAGGGGIVSLLSINPTTGRPENSGGNAKEVAKYSPVLVSLPSE